MRHNPLTSNKPTRAYFGISFGRDEDILKAKKSVVLYSVLYLDNDSTQCAVSSFASHGPCIAVILSYQDVMIHLSDCHCMHVTQAWPQDPSSCSILREELILQEKLIQDTWFGQQRSLENDCFLSRPTDPSNSASVELSRLATRLTSRHASPRVYRDSYPMLMLTPQSPHESSLVPESFAEAGHPLAAKYRFARS